MTVQRPPTPQPDALPLCPEGHFWVFAYGSLIWRPGFDHISRHPALLQGFHRRFCLWSHRYRGTPEVPGLVLGLDRGGACRGVAFRVQGRDAAAVLRILDDRELPDGAEVVYVRRVLRVRLLDTPEDMTNSRHGVPAIAYVANRASRNYVARLPPEQAAASIARGIGQMGPNRDYLLNTLTHLDAMGVRDTGLRRIAALLPR